MGGCVGLEPAVGLDRFAGHVVEAAGESPFDVWPPSEDWLRELHSFGWLRHLRAADTPLARSNARAVVEDWLTLHRRPGGETVWDTSRPDGQPVRYLDVSRAAETIGFRAEVQLDEGLRRTVDSFKASNATS